MRTNDGLDTPKKETQPPAIQIIAF